MTIDQQIGDAIKKRYEKKGFNQATFAAEVGLEARALRRLEKGEHSPTITTLLRVAAALGCSVRDLIPPNA